MANKGHIIVPSGLTPVHSFDLWGPVIDSVELGMQQLAFFKEVAAGELPPEEIEKLTSDYVALLRGEPWATQGDEKRRIAGAIKQYTAGKFEGDFSTTYQLDGLQAMREIIDAGERVSIFSTMPVEGTIENLPEDIRERLVGVIYANDLETANSKSEASAYHEINDMLAGRKMRMVSHTADELPELEAAVQSGLFAGNQGLTVFVNRNDQVSPDLAKGKGIDLYVNDLGTIPYGSLVRDK